MWHQLIIPFPKLPMPPGVYWLYVTARKKTSETDTSAPQNGYIFTAVLTNTRAARWWTACCIREQIIFLSNGLCRGGQAFTDVLKVTGGITIWHGIPKLLKTRSFEMAFGCVRGVDFYTLVLPLGKGCVPRELTTYLEIPQSGSHFNKRSKCLVVCVYKWMTGGNLKFE